MSPDTVDPGTPIDLANCDREPIHIPGTIQPHGLLLAFDAQRRLGHASVNAGSLLQLPLALGAPFEALGLASRVEDHRLPEGANAERERTSGYIKVSTVRRLAEEAGFKFVGASEVNANPKDTADWPDGVWTLPPTLQKGNADREKYLAIGESDRFTLKFRKPE